jgi:hypothetical protein
MSRLSRGSLLFVILAAVYVLMSGAAAAADTVTWPSSNQDGQFTDAEAVTVSGSFVQVDNCSTGTNDTPLSAQTDLWIVPTGSVGQGQPLAVVPNASKTTIQAVGDGTSSGPIAFPSTLISPVDELAPGSYDLIFDECQDGTLDAQDTVLTGALTITQTSGIHPATAGQLSDAVSGQPGLVTGASLQRPAVGVPDGVGSGVSLLGMPVDGDSFGILTTGDARVAGDPNDSPNTTTVLSQGRTQGRGDAAYDTSVLELDVNVPASDNCLAFDFRFASEEFPEFVGSKFNDAFVAELDATTWTTSADGGLSAPDNFAFDAAGNPISVNAVGPAGVTPDDAAGSTYDAATPLLTASTPVTPGPHALYLSITDVGDPSYDSAVVLDDLHSHDVANPVSGCAPGAKPAAPDIAITPVATTNNAGDADDLTATVSQDSHGLGNVPVLFSVHGPNQQTGVAVTTAADGTAHFTDPGTNAGTDTITACADTNDNGSCDAGEPTATATATFKDVTAPTISLTVPPDGATYAPGAAATVSFSCADEPGGSGVATCSGTQPSGAALNTTPGTHTFAVTATDKAGNTATTSHTYTVIAPYTFGGFLAPVNNPNTVNAGKAGRTYPLKWRLTDAQGNNVTTLSAVSSITYHPTNCGTFSSDTADALETTATGGTSLRYDTTAGQYIYNWATPNKGCYTLSLKLDTGQVFQAYFNLT